MVSRPAPGNLQNLPEATTKSSRESGWGAMLLYLLILGVSLVELAVSFRWRRADGARVPAAYVAPAFEGAGLMAVGESMSALTRHETAAALLTLPLCMVVLRYYGRGVLDTRGVLVRAKPTSSATRAWARRPRPGAKLAVMLLTGVSQDLPISTL